MMYSSDITEQFPLNSPTALMTPNTIKTIEQSILASLEGTSSNPTIIASAATGSFVPPLPSSLTTTTTLQAASSQIIASNTNGGSCWAGGTKEYSNNNSYYNSSVNSTTTTEDERDDLERDDLEKPRTRKPATKRQTGRKPKRAAGNPEEEERRRIRRERNKLAAARCRKRRVDHTNLLLEETEELEQVRRSLQELIEKTQQEKEELEFILEAHMPTCKKMCIKTERQSPERYPVSQPVSQPVSTSEKPVRPTSLLVSNASLQTVTTSTGIPISTPSNGLNIGFDNIDWSELPATGLTPTVTSVSGIMNTPLVTPSTAHAILQSLGASSASGGNKFVNL